MDSKSIHNKFKMDSKNQNRFEIDSKQIQYKFTINSVKQNSKKIQDIFKTTFKINSN